MREPSSSSAEYRPIGRYSGREGPVRHYSRSASSGPTRGCCEGRANRVPKVNCSGAGDRRATATHAGSPSSRPQTRKPTAPGVACSARSIPGARSVERRTGESAATRSPARRGAGCTCRGSDRPRARSGASSRTRAPEQRSGKGGPAINSTIIVVTGVALAALLMFYLIFTLRAPTGTSMSNNLEKARENVEAARADDDPAQIRPRQVGGNRSQHRDRRCAHRGHNRAALKFI